MNELQQLQNILKQKQKVAIAYSGGCDSNFLLKVALDTLGKDNVLAIMCKGAMMPKEDIQQALLHLKDCQYHIIDVDVFEVEDFVHNSKKRCYYCKRNIMSKVKDYALSKGFTHVIDGTNKDDTKVYRPGRQALEELGIESPINEANMTKQMVRDYSKQLGIDTYNKPANACLASRFPYDTTLTKEKLLQVDKAETFLHQAGYYQVRCRVHDDIARIELNKEDFQRIINDQQLIQKIKETGFEYVVLDLEGLTSGRYDKKG